jgi:hypothetical protein
MRTVTTVEPTLENLTEWVTIENIKAWLVANEKPGLGRDTRNCVVIRFIQDQVGRFDLGCGTTRLSHPDGGQEITFTTRGSAVERLINLFDEAIHQREPVREPSRELALEILEEVARDRAPA